MTDFSLNALTIYPIKSVRGIELAEAALKPRGLEGDRRWVIADDNGVFLSQRNCPALAKVTAVLIADGLRLSFDGGDSIDVAPPSDGARGAVTVWKHQVNAVAAPGADAWLAAHLGRTARLYFMDADAERLTSTKWTPIGHPVSFADAYPYLITTTGSLRALNTEIESHGGAPVGMDRFRSNIVINCDEPWAEDRWRVLRIGGAELELIKPCDRCVMTTLDQKTGADKGKEPLESLMRLRKSGDARVKGVLFGWNAILRRAETIRLGDRVTVLDDRLEGWPLA